MSVARHCDCGDRWPDEHGRGGVSWRRAWPLVIPFFASPPDIRRTIDTTNALENVNRQIRTATKTRGRSPTDEAAITLIWLAIRNLTARWARGDHYWKTAMNQLAISQKN